MSLALTEKQRKMLLLSVESNLTENMARSVFSTEKHMRDVLMHLVNKGFLKPDFCVFHLTPEGRAT